MPSRERRLLDKDKEIRKLQGELKHYKTCFFSCVFDLDRTKKQLETAVSALKYIQNGNLGFSPAMDFAEKALEQINKLKDVK